MKKTNYKPEKEFKPTEELEAKEGEWFLKIAERKNL